MSLLRKLFRGILIRNPEFWVRYGIQVTPDHFYYPVPSLKDFGPGFFKRVSPCGGIDWNTLEQKRHLTDVFSRYIGEIKPDHSLKMLSSIDSVVYYSMIRSYEPRKIIEIGSGESTRYAALAHRTNNSPCELVCIEPYPDDGLLKGLDGVARLIQKKVQDVGIGEFEGCDMLFIDSSHVVKMGSDVLWEILEVLPHLKKGCLIHWHDIFMPGEYPEEFVKNRIFWSEQYLLRAFLMFNRDFEIIWASNYMKVSEPGLVEEFFGEHSRHEYPVSSFWIRRIRDPITAP